MGCKLWVCYSNGHWKQAKKIYVATGTGRWVRGKSIWRYIDSHRKWEIVCLPSLPHISTHPRAVTVVRAATAKFVVAASPYDSMHWEHSAHPTGPWTKIAGGTTLSIRTQNKDYAYYYRAVFINQWGTSYTTTAKLIVKLGPPVIVGSLPTVNVRFGQKFTFCVTDVLPHGTQFFWQWRKPGGHWQGWGRGNQKCATGRADGAGMNLQQYRLLATNTAGQVSTNFATLRVT